MANEENLRLGYSAVLSAKGYTVITEAEHAINIFAVILDIGGNIEEHEQALAGMGLTKALFIVPKHWIGRIPAVGAEQYLLHKPVTAGAILKLLRG
jgi:hypothetical protein